MRMPMWWRGGEGDKVEERGFSEGKKKKKG
jgi:hypothetical protein